MLVQLWPLTFTKSHTASVTPAITQALVPGLEPVGDMKLKANPPIWLIGGPPPPISEGGPRSVNGSSGGTVMALACAVQGHRIPRSAKAETQSRTVSPLSYYKFAAS